MTDSDLVKVLVLLSALSFAATGLAQGGDWPQWGRDQTRNMASGETNLPNRFSMGKFIGNSEELDLSTAENVKWVAKLGSQAYGNPTVAGGRAASGERFP